MWDYVKGDDSMELRFVLYGYYKEQFIFRVVPEEAEIVQKIYRDYVKGSPLSEIAKELTNNGVPYYKDKTEWSKNTVRRILENTHYLGDDEYPAIISKALLQCFRMKSIVEMLCIKKHIVLIASANERKSIMVKKQNILLLMIIHK